MTIKVLLTRLVTTSLLALGLNFIETSQAQAVSPCSNVDINYYINDAKNLIEVRSKGAPNREILQQGNQNNIVGIYTKRPRITLSNAEPNPDFKAQDELWRSELFSLWKKWEKETKNIKIKNTLAKWSKPSGEPYTHYRNLKMIMRNQKC